MSDELSGLWNLVKMLVPALLPGGWLQKLVPKLE
jgi:hypothetical protein